MDKMPKVADRMSKVIDRVPELIDRALKCNKVLRTNLKAEKQIAASRLCVYSELWSSSIGLVGSVGGVGC